MSVMTTVPDEAVELFREAPEGFVAARDALAARLRDEGRDDEARAVKGLRKPTVVAWALNRLSVDEPDGVRRLLDAGAEVRAAQQAALSSKRGATERLRAAGVTRRAAISELVAAATTALSGAGRSSATHADALAQALDACSIDPDSGATLMAGTFDRPPGPSPGFGGVLGLTALDGGGEPDPADKSEPASPARRGPAGSGGRAAAEVRAEVARLRRDRDGADRRAKKARAAADGFAHELEGMRRRLEVVERKHADAAGAAAEGELEVAKAERALRRATDRLDEA
jgi:hypothetical protein